MLKYFAFYVRYIVSYYTQHLKSAVLIAIFVYGFSSSSYAGYWREYAYDGFFFVSSDFPPFMQGAKITPFSAEVIAGGAPNLIGKGNTYVGNSQYGTRVRFGLFRYNNTTAIVGLNGSGPLTTTTSSTGRCYFIPSFYASYYEPGSTAVYTHATSAVNNSIGVYYAPEQSAIINKNCNEINGDDPELSQLMISVDVAEYYIAWGTPIYWVSGDRINNWAIEEYGRMRVLNLTTNYNFSPKYDIFICPTNVINSQCVRTSQAGSGGSENGGGEVIIPATCDLSGNNDGLDFGTVSNDDFIGKKAMYQLDVSCSRDAVIKLSIVRIEDIKLGPFKVKVNINNEESPIVNIGTDITTLNVDGTLEGAIGEVKPGNYENSLIILAEQQ